MVAALTGANVLEGTATPTPSGSTVRLDGGGELASADAAERPGADRRSTPGSSSSPTRDACALTDTVVSVRHDRGGC